MGKPKFSRKKYETPSHPWEMERIKEENELIKKYGLKNKREIWKAETRLRKYRGQARSLLAKIETDIQSKKESDQLLMHLSRMNILPPNSTLDDILTLDTEAILSRRLQTLTYLKGLASTPQQARQLIAHGHISVSGKKVTIPGYMIAKEEESNISYIDNSPLNDAMHPARPRGEFDAVPFKRPEKTKEDEKVEPSTEMQKPAEQPTDAPAEPQPDEKPMEQEPPKEEQLQETEAPVEEPTVEENSTEPESAPAEPLKEETQPAEEPAKEEEKPAEKDKKEKSENKEEN